MTARQTFTKQQIKTAIIAAQETLSDRADGCAEIIADFNSGCIRIIIGNSDSVAARAKGANPFDDIGAI